MIMNRSFEIVTDSCCNLTEETIGRFELHVLPLTFMADGDDTVYHSYLKGEKTDLSQFYTMMREGKVFRTSLPNLADTEKLFRSLLEQGRDILYLGFSSGLVGHLRGNRASSAAIARGIPAAQAADGGHACRHQADKGCSVWHACQRAEQGEDIEAVRDWTEANKLHLAHWFTVDDLMFLWRGGRVSKTSAWAGTLLNIKPVMHVDDEGHLVPLEKVRGRKKSLTALLDHMERSGTAPIAEQTVFITHGDCIDDAKWLEKQDPRNVSGSKTSASTTSTPSSVRIPARAPWRCSSWHRTAIRNPSDTK